MSCTTAAGHVEENSGSLCLFQGCCVESGIGLCRGEQEGGCSVCGSAGKPGSQSGQWLNHLLSTSWHPPLSPNTREHTFSQKHISTYIQKLTDVCSFLIANVSVHWKQEDGVAGNRKYKTALFSRTACDADAKHTRKTGATREQN